MKKSHHSKQEQAERQFRKEEKLANPRYRQQGHLSKAEYEYRADRRAERSAHHAEVLEARAIVRERIRQWKASRVNPAKSKKWMR